MTNTTKDMTQQQLIDTFRGLGCTVTPKSWDVVVDDQVAYRYGVAVKISHLGSTEIEIIREGQDVDPAAIVAQMRARLGIRNTATRAAIRRERRPT